MRNVVHGVDSHLIPKAKQARYTDPKFVDPKKNDGSAFTATELRRQRIDGRVALGVDRSSMRRSVEKRESARSFASSGGARPRKSSGCAFAKPPGRCGARKRRRFAARLAGAAPGSPGAQVSHRGSSGTSRQPGTPRMAGSKVHAERQALALASAGEAALLSGSSALRRSSAPWSRVACRASSRSDL